MNYREQFYEGEIDGKTLLDVIDEKEAEAQALREEVAALRKSEIVGSYTIKHMAIDIAAVGEALGISSEDQEGGTGEFIEAIQELQEELEGLRARVVVFPDFDNDVIIDTFRRNGFLIELGASYSVKGQIAQLLNALEELARLNGKAVSEGLLRSAYDSIKGIVYSAQQHIAGLDECPCHVCACTRATVIAEALSALLGEGKEPGP